MIPGGTGYLGRALTERLVARGDEVVVLTRGPARHAEGWRAVTWMPARRATGRRRWTAPTPNPGVMHVASWVTAGMIVWFGPTLFW